MRALIFVIMVPSLLLVRFTKVAIDIEFKLKIIHAIA